MMRHLKAWGVGLGTLGVATLGGLALAWTVKHHPVLVGEVIIALGLLTIAAVFVLLGYLLTSP